MGKSTFADHPLHPQPLVPVAPLPFGAVLDTVHSAPGKVSYAGAACYSMVGGCVGGLAAAAAGAGDHFTERGETHTKTIASLHAALNLGVLGRYSASLLLRRAGREPGKVVMLLSLPGTAGLLTSAGYGGSTGMAFAQKGVDPVGTRPRRVCRVVRSSHACSRNCAPGSRRQWRPARAKRCPPQRATADERRNSMGSQTETFAGYVVDLACIRKYPHAELLERARAHTKKCALMGHCVESGYALVGEDGTTYALDATATPQIVRSLEKSAKDAGIRLEATRRRDGEEMATSSVREV